MVVVGVHDGDAVGFVFFRALSPGLAREADDKKTTEDKATY